MKNKKVIIISSIVFGIIILGLIGYLIFRNRTAKNEVVVVPTVTPTVSATVTSTKTAKATKTATKTPTSTPTPVATKSDTQLIGEALGVKLSQDPSNLDITISKQSATAAYGSVNVKGDTGGAWFVAVQQGDHWLVIADGNGTIDCAILDQYNVPNTVVGECYDSVTESSKTR